MDKVKEAAWVENAAGEHFDRGNGSRLNVLTMNHAPGHKAFPRGEKRPGGGIHSIQENYNLVVGKQGRDILLVGLDRVEGFVGIGLFVGRILEFDYD